MMQEPGNDGEKSFCPKCGKLTETFDKWCMDCGAVKLTDSSSSSSRPSGIKAETHLKHTEAGAHRYYCVGHGMLHPREKASDFRVHPRVTLFFAVPHDNNYPAGTPPTRYSEAETRRSGESCRDYRLWPLTGAEKIPLHADSFDLLSYHQLPYDKRVLMLYYSKPTYERNRLSEIIARITSSFPAALPPLEIVWCACREEVEDAPFETQRKLAGENIEMDSARDGTYI